MTAEEKKLILADLKFSSIPIRQTGGQHAGSIPQKVVIEHEELGFRIELNHYRGVAKNREVGMQLFELFLMSIS